MWIAASIPFWIFGIAASLVGFPALFIAINNWEPGCETLKGSARRYKARTIFGGSLFLIAAGTALTMIASWMVS